MSITSERPHRPEILTAATTFSIYLITNKVNGKHYVGLTRLTIAERFRAHTSKANCRSRLLLPAAIYKYGVTNFTIDLIQTADSECDAQTLERSFIQEYGSFVPNGYNMTRGGETPDPDLCSGYATEIWKREEFRNLRKRLAAKRRRARVRATARANIGAAESSTMVDNVPPR
jgi:group I intron endonuclease